MHLGSLKVRLSLSPIMVMTMEVNIQEAIGEMRSNPEWNKNYDFNYALFPQHFRKSQLVQYNSKPRQAHTATVYRRGNDEKHDSDECFWACPYRYLCQTDNMTFRV